MTSLDIDGVARERFGLDHLHPDQREAIRAAVDGRDVLVVWATGSGKSAVYQIAAALRPGIAVVVSPLIALQADQVERLGEAPDAPVGAVLNSTRGARATRDTWERVDAGEIEYLLLAPEQLAKDDVVTRVAEAGVSLFVVDEAHCIAAWGHDFRPDYLVLGDAVERLGRPPVLALTATASLPVRREIVERLGLRDPVILAGDVDRPNIDLAVRRHPEDADKRAAVVDDVAGLPMPGLVYVATRRSTQEYAADLTARGLRVAAYHGGLPAKERERVHERFHAGELDVVVATSAFGMGIDKPDVRFVVHADVPDSVDAYYQELGRAGRDGAAARATLHYRPEDLALRTFFATKHPDAPELRRVVGALAARGTVSRADLAAAAEVAPRRLTALLSLLVDTAAARIDRNGASWLGRDEKAAVAAALQRSEDREHIDRSRVDMMRGYAETRRCRRHVLLGYFGQELPEPCGHCDTCADGSAYAAQAASVGGDEWQVDEPVTHAEWGEGTVMAVEADRITVFFESQGYKTLARAVISEHGLLRESFTGFTGVRP
ncbi:RecQ family ATP-dependent DNA helicase [Microbacterium sp. 10M-3C3]|jgi:ATP-dependent DNA helicase RecQ|uniref:RecQ family ATP-dependent DNA helicase n=1 Tax=Microbacterium sp. 10M-3C3 TaxID=2483401 RepID=UPI000F63938B|nr:RecQ family ATP-dependent DNA helicase [Microbacterium sp. 10M-3C3]